MPNLRACVPRSARVPAVAHPWSRASGVKIRMSASMRGVHVGMFNSDIYSDRHSNIAISGYHFRITNIISNVANAKLPLIREHKT